MKVSVCMVTYNHERFIEQAVASVLTQEISFEYEIVIGEDCSTDRTRDILIELQHANPDKIRLLLREHNLGAQRNFVQTLDACQGQYIAYLEGDDYWTSNAKLQRQVDFLDQHADFAICFHNAIKFYDDGSEPATLICPDDQPTISTIEDILRKNFIPACSVMFRNRLFGAFPDWFFDLKLGDWPLHILNAQYGKIGYINEVMAAYRLHRVAAWSSLTPDQIIAYAGEMFRHIDAHFVNQYHQVIELAIGDLYTHWAWQIITHPMSVEVAQTMLDLASRIDPEAQARLLHAIAARAAALDRSKIWLTQQRDNWQAEAERHGQHAIEQQEWIEQQKANWQAVAEEHMEWIKQLEQARDYHAQQASNWQTLAEGRAEWIKQLEQARDYHAQQASNWQTVAEAQMKPVKG
jgi:glycosyltransferase involved in cell wall biosynthesis